MSFSKLIPQSIKSKFIKHTVREKFTIDNVTYYIVDFTCPLPFYKDRRYFALWDKNKNERYFHSGVYLDEKEINQPILIIPQKIAKIWDREITIKNALVLGGAGCTVPRFLLLNNSDVKVTAVEYVQKFVDLAKKYFMLSSFENRLNLICADAYEFIKEEKCPINNDYIFVDIFSGANIPEKELTQEFINNLYDITSNDGIVVINLLNLDMDITTEFVKNISTPFNKKYLIYDDAHRTVCLQKSNRNIELKNMGKNVSFCEY